MTFTELILVVMYVRNLKRVSVFATQKKECNPGIKNKTKKGYVIKTKQN